jgi:hypothetical protein
VFCFFGSGLEGSGTKYRIDAGGSTVASWLFTKPTDVPKQYAAAVCKILSPKIKKTSKTGSLVSFKTNGKCLDGSFALSYGYLTEGTLGGGFGSLSVVGGPKKYSATTDSLTLEDVPFIFTVSYRPNGEIQGSTSKEIKYFGKPAKVKQQR